MLVLYETASGYGLFKVTNDAKLSNVNDLSAHFATPELANKLVTLKKFEKFGNTTEALAATTALVESKLHKRLKTFLKSSLSNADLKESLAVQDSKLGGVIKEEVGIQCLSGTAVSELFRGIRTHFSSLVSSSEGGEVTAMALGLSHSLSRYKLKFSPDKVDTMIVQAIALLDMLDKELNVFAMRAREWYGWHFPELSKIIPDNITFCRLIIKMGTRPNAASTDLSELLPSELEEEVKEAAVISMGTEISSEDIDNIVDLCNQVIEISAYREELSEYLKNRMQAIAPNLTLLLGELVGARLIAHAGSLLNLAKHPASTVQILGAEKALFRALKTKHETPKYGLIYHASLIGQTTPKNKGKISRLLAAKASLSCRVDALGEKDENVLIGADLREKVMARIKQVDGTQPTKQIAKVTKSASNMQTQPKKFDPTHTSEATVRYAPKYNTDSDTTLEIVKPAKGEEKEVKKDKKKKKKEEKDESETGPEEKKKKKKKDSSKKEKVESTKEKKKAVGGEEKKKKKRKADDANGSEETKPKKKKTKSS